MCTSRINWLGEDRMTTATEPVRTMTPRGLRAPVLATLVLELLALGCSHTISTRHAERLARGEFIGGPLTEYASFLGTIPEHVELMRHRDSTLGLPGWVEVPASRLKDWWTGEKKRGFPEKGYVLVWSLRVEDRPSLIVPLAAVTALGAAAYAISPAQQANAYTSGRADVLGPTDPRTAANFSKDRDKMEDRRHAAALTEQRGPNFRFWAYVEGARVKAYNFPVKNALGGVTPSACGLKDVPVAADSLLKSILQMVLKPQPGGR